MSQRVLEVIDPGMFTTVQDRGRYGYQRFGVPVSGAMDEFALRAANLLVGNEDGAAALEMTVIGPSLRFLADTWIAVTGSDLSPRLDGESLPRWETVQVAAGSELTFHGMEDGMRAYLAVAGGIDVPTVMGSRSTYAGAGFGGLEGRALTKGDVVSRPNNAPEPEFVQRRLPDGYVAPTYGEHHDLDVILGPQRESFTAEAIETLLGATYVVSMDSDRMGCRLDGPRIVHKTGPDIVSDGNPPGAIQVPGDGLPMILLADRGTTGGYAKIATVVSSDLGELAQAVPGHTVSFNAVTVDEAHDALRQREAVLRAITDGAALAAPPPGISVRVNGEGYEVVDEDGRLVSRLRLTGEVDGARVHRARATVAGHTFEFDVEVQRQG